MRILLPCLAVYVPAGHCTAQRCRDISLLVPTRICSACSDSEFEEAGNGKPALHSRRCAHHGAVNRVRAMPQAANLGGHASRDWHCHGMKPALSEHCRQYGGRPRRCSAAWAMQILPRFGMCIQQDLWSCTIFTCTSAGIHVCSTGTHSPGVAYVHGQRPKRARAADVSMVCSCRFISLWSGFHDLNAAKTQALH